MDGKVNRKEQRTNERILTPWKATPDDLKQKKKTKKQQQQKKKKTAIKQISLNSFTFSDSSSDAN